MEQHIWKGFVMNIQKFIARRKELGFSQSELAKGICTQATISKFENGGKMISTKILTQLCQRLGLSLSDIFPGPVDRDSKLLEKLHQAEFNLITMEYEDVAATLSEISMDQMDDDDTKMEYLFIKGYLFALSDYPTSDAVFCFDQILNGLDEEHQTIFSQLAYVGLGIAYEHEKNFERADFYFSKMPQQLQSKRMYGVDDIWKTLTMLFYTGNYYSYREDFVTGNMLLQSLIHMSSKRHVTFYVARAQFRLARNFEGQHVKQAVINETIRDAYAFAKFNGNQKLISRIERYQHQYKTK
ncbi:helix-turn-helix domain-containing protein [Lentilactobacillus hilgardii]|uniref:helix-turn-helix domain-containing protein n=1 Tax=Lentilactobacillus hilgardii TaxID=1588 RepID=UPI0021A4C0FB|nr:helix-turn-helix transcriptional regulator [Lentilactobacillus hilgardii]MCT3398758.1 XRE family transcriptional regulator [Lentilactobacillus hilgardii]